MSVAHGEEELRRGGDIESLYFRALPDGSVLEGMVSCSSVVCALGTYEANFWGYLDLMDSISIVLEMSRSIILGYCPVSDISSIVVV